LTAPILSLATLLPLSALVSPDFTPRSQWQLLAVGLFAGAFEEIGWTGFATPRLLKRHGAWIAGLALGLVWAIWHLLVDLRYNAGALGGFWVFEFAIVYLATLTPYRILMTWVYEHADSLLLSVLMHASFTGSLLMMVPATTFAHGLVWQAIFSSLLWVTAAWVWSRPSRRQAAHKAFLPERLGIRHS
jgi:membrane protease YdiL (CAAX protease family)